LFDRLVAMTGARAKVRLTIHRVISRPVRAVPAPGKGGAHGYFSYADPHDAGIRYLHLEPDDAAPAPGRVACNEAQIVASARLREGVATARAGTIGTLVETVIALNKWLIETTVGRERKLLFSNLELDQLVAGQPLVEVKLLRSLGSRMFQSQVTLEASTRGEVVFMGVPR
jgi:hypothetical protein